MSKIIFISNRLPVTVNKNEDILEYHKSIGGLATGLKSYHEQSDSIWVGWTGISDDAISTQDKIAIRGELKDKYKCIPVFLADDDIEKYYYGFCNNTIWPLFHYFANKTEYEFDTWEAYKEVNRKFFEAVEPIIKDGDIVWIHDYQLMLLPQMIKDKYPGAKVGFFLHIPFPSYEIFRLLIWREEILLGLIGADLIGFHTYDYVRHFLSSTNRLLGLEHNLHKISFEDRQILVEAFPMGIDYDFFSREHVQNAEAQEQTFENIKGMKMILSIDRLDYTKGIPERLKAFNNFLSEYPEYRGNVRLNLIVAPSREKVNSYEHLKREITELVSVINGKYGTVNWMPVWFYFQSFSQEDLISFYRHSDVLLVTPLRDGMNLVAKEYVASRTDYEGMVVISETAGAASELGEAVVVNANDYDAIACGIKTALEMPIEEKISRNIIMQQRLKRYNVEFWASEFINTLNTVTEESNIHAQTSIDNNSNPLLKAYHSAEKRILFLDYDGTLVGFKSLPEQAKPDEDLKNVLTDLVKDTKNTVVIVSGRDRHTLEKWFGGLNLHLLASHGLWLLHPGQEWNMTISLDNDWKDSVRHLLQMYTDRMPGSLIEEKEYSLAWHYRQCEPDMAAVKLIELRAALLSMTSSMSLGLQEGNKVVEIKDNRVNKGYIASLFLRDHDFDFVFGAGDDLTDEDLFAVLPENAYSVKVGSGNSQADYRIKSWKSMRLLLHKFVAE
ncbi:MAG: bifunctional alpha,alpha-trehalose-phosphate synthase (UDP-forming)/trehalose-phosphatase [Lachnospiraceae bacterium]|nr:bifunctional alpha,alpha-trehalose-phosphate synthase (UDP-forming)/trehalose-phosphatase [Lachnospiraceae bacterium]